MQNEDMTPAEWHNHEEYGADVDQFGYPDEERALGNSTFWRKGGKDGNNSGRESDIFSNMERKHKVQN